MLCLQISYAAEIGFPVEVENPILWQSATDAVTGNSKEQLEAEERCMRQLEIMTPAFSNRL